MTTLAPEQARAFLAGARGDRLEALYVLALSTGMRQGELLGLRWKDVNLERGVLQVKSTLQRGAHGFVFSEPKTARSRRQIILTKVASAGLKRHRIRQAEERLSLGEAWEDNDLVFANEAGRPIESTNLVRRSFRSVLNRAGLPRMRFHDLRHTYATLALGQGVHPKVVSDALGHANISITLDTYSHTTAAMHQQAADALDAVLRR
jgi:integrase